MSLKLIKLKNFSLYRSLTSFFSRQFYFKFLKLSKSSNSLDYETHRLQRFRLYRVNLKVKRDFPHTLKTLTCYLNSDADSEFISISRVDFISTSEQSSSKAPLELIFNEELFRLRAKSYTSVFSILFIWSLSSNSLLDLNYIIWRNQDLDLPESSR